MRADDLVKFVSPGAVLEQIATAIPVDCRENIIVVGSLAAGFRFFAENPKLYVLTKDVDCLLSPRVKAIAAGEAVAESLFAAEWQYHPTAEFPAPGTAQTEEASLPVARLDPPGATEWFIELLTVPESENDLGQRQNRIETSRGHFSMCSFGFLSLCEYQPIATKLGIAIARPEMMALANLLHHPAIGAQKMSGLIRDRAIKRSNKDLGRVLALAWLSEESKEDALLAWPALWLEGLQKKFPSHWPELARRAGAGLRELLRTENQPDLEEARYMCEFGLLASRPPTLETLRVTGRRLLADAVEPLEESAR